MKQLILFFIISVVGCATSCVSFPNNSKVGFHLNESNISEFNGVFENQILLSICGEDIYQKSFFVEIDRDKIRDSTAVEIKNWDSSFKLSVLSESETEIEFTQGDRVIGKRMLKSKIDKDGFLYIKNNNVKLTGIPYLLGVLDIKKIRLSLDKEGDLVLENVQHTSGAFMFIFYWGTYNYHYVKSYKRIK